MRILLVSSYLPFPLYSGGHVRLYNLLKKLSSKHEITLVCEIRNWQTKADVAELEKICKKVKVVKRKKQWSVKNILRTGLSSDPFLLIGHKSREMKSIIKKELKDNKYDLIHIETFYVMQNLPQVTYKIPVILVEHNIEYLVYKRFAEKSSKILRPLLRVDIEKIKRNEEYYWKKADFVVAVSEEEKKMINRDNVFVVPNGVDTSKFKLGNVKNSSNKVLFMGDFKWIQNINSVNFILDNIWPNVSSKLKDAKLWIVGKNIPESLKNRKIKNVFFDENASDSTEKIYQEADVLLAPIFVGGGTSFKILESMASGLPVVTTSLGAEGITAKNKEEMLIGDDSEALSENTILILRDLKLREKISKSARNLIEEKYSWDYIAKELEKVYNKATAK